MTKCLFIPVGGLAQSQLRTLTTGILWWKRTLPGIIDAVKAIPDVKVFDNSGWDEFRGGGIWDWLDAQLCPRVILCGHSLGVDTCLHTAEVLEGRCVGLILLDPVWQTKRKPACPALVLHAGNSFPFPQAQVEGVANVTIPGTDHNSLCHRAAVIEMAVQFASDILRGR